MKRLETEVTDDRAERLRQLAFEHGTSVRALLKALVGAVCDGDVVLSVRTETVEREVVTFRTPGRENGMPTGKKKASRRR